MRNKLNEKSAGAFARLMMWAGRAATCAALAAASLFTSVASGQSGYWHDAANRDLNWTFGAQGYIGTAQQLAQFAYLVNSSNDGLSGVSVFLNADIDLSAHWWTPAGTNGTHSGLSSSRDPAAAFCGFFDGRGHIIKGVKINNPEADFQGLFGVVFGGGVGNVNLVETDITGRSMCGGIVGISKRSKIASVSNSGLVRGARSVGGLVGTMRDGVGGVINGFNSALVVASSGEVGGIVGRYEAGRIENTYNRGVVSGNSAGALVGTLFALEPVIANSYYWDTGSPAVGDYGGTTPLDQMVNLESFGAAPGTLANTHPEFGTDALLDTLNACVDVSLGIGRFASWEIRPGVNGGYPVFAGSTLGFDFNFWEDVPNRDENYMPNLTTGSTNTIHTAGELAQFAWLVNNTGNGLAGVTFELDADIDLTAHYWTPAGASVRELLPDDTYVTTGPRFKGTFDGKNHIITGIRTEYNDESRNYRGLFGVNEGHIKNVELERTLIVGRVVNSGGLVGWNAPGGTIDNTSNRSGAVSGSAAVGGLVGINGGTIRNSYNAAGYNTISAFSGGLAANNEASGIIENCYNIGSLPEFITAIAPRGTLVAVNSGTILNSFAAGDRQHLIGQRPVPTIEAYNDGFWDAPGTLENGPGQYGSDQLPDELNAWVNAHPGEEYRAWTLVPGVNGDYPVFGGIEPRTELTITSPSVYIIGSGPYTITYTGGVNPPDAQYSVGGVTLSGATFTPTEPGALALKVNEGGLTSFPFTLLVLPKPIIVFPPILPPEWTNGATLLLPAHISSIAVTSLPDAVSTLGWTLPTNSDPASNGYPVVTTTLQPPGQYRLAKEFIILAKAKLTDPDWIPLTAGMPLPPPLAAALGNPATTAVDIPSSVILGDEKARFFRLFILVEDFEI
jgi:hypothetical protein